MAIVQITTKTLTEQQPQTYLIADNAAGLLTLTVKNITGFGLDQVLLIGDFGNGDAEIIKTSHVTPPSGNTITLATSTVFAHSSSTFITVIPYDKIELTTATTLTGAKTILNGGQPFNIVANTETTNYNDSLNSVGYYFVRFFNTLSGFYSTYSAGIPAAGYTLFSARSIINSSLSEINKKTSEVLSDEFMFQQIDLCQIECIRELKRWSFMQKFDQIWGQLSTGQWKIALPIDVDDQNTNKSIYKLRVGGEEKIDWIDKDTFDRMIGDMAYTTLALPISVNDTTITLTHSGDFGSTGTITIGANSYTYTANNTFTNVLTIPASTTTNLVGADVLFGASSGLPRYWTTYGGFAYLYPVVASTYNNRNVYGDYYSALVQTTLDTQNIIIPDPSVVQNYLCWKSLKKLNNGLDTVASTAYQTTYEGRKTKMKNKEVKNRTFKLKPRINNFARQTSIGSDNRDTRTGNFPNTGF